jgi:hypothetical protein
MRLVQRLSLYQSLSLLNLSPNWSLELYQVVKDEYHCIEALVIFL